MLASRETKLAVAIATAALAACSGAPTMPSVPTTPSAAITTAQGDSIATLVSGEAMALAQSTMLSGSSTPSFAIAALGETRPDFAVASGCTPTRTPSSPADPDADGVPDSVRIDYTGCVISQPSATIRFSGIIDLTDPTKNTKDFAARRVFTDFLRTRTDAATGKVRSEKRNGVQVRSGTSTQLQHSETNVRTDYAYENGSTASHTRTWQSTFNADAGKTILENQPLPSGTWSIAGTSTWVRRGVSHSLSVKTLVPVHYNPACSAAEKLDAGTSRVVVMGKDNSTATVTIQYTGCGTRKVLQS